MQTNFGLVSERYSVKSVCIGTWIRLKDAYHRSFEYGIKTGAKYG
jgi:hypothetical protein